MTDLQWYAYLGGFAAFMIGCYVYYLSRSKNLNDGQIKTRKRIMNFFFNHSISMRWLFMVINLRYLK